jgi:MYXO-CTERM domain-containing protein
MKTSLLIALTLVSQAEGFGGTQPGDLTVGLAPPESCNTCHASATMEGLPGDRYRGTMMNLATVDPVFEAALEIAYADDAAAAELCVRCHTPTGWLAGRATPTDGSGLAISDKHGISCDVCHRAISPPGALVDGGPGMGDGGAGADAGMGLPWDATSLLLENTQLFFRDDNIKNGSYDPSDAPGTTHGMAQYPLLKDSRLCAHCHEVTNPIRTRKTLDGTDTGMPMPVERTYTEWLLSDFSQAGGKTCQECHMPASTGPDATSGPNRAVRSHQIVGGNSVTPYLVAHFQNANPLPHWPQDLSADADRIATEVRRVLAEESADLTALTVSGAGAGRQLQVRLENKTGHKLPTGYAEGRRMWIAHQVRAPDGSISAQSGSPDPITFDIVAGEDPIRIWEIKLGQSGQGESFHFALADAVYKDNRIPPQGFVPNADVQPVGQTYPDLGGGILAHYDDVDLPLGTPACYPAEVTVTVYYQAISGEYFRFLRDNAPINGPRLAEAWTAIGGGGPEQMQTLTVQIAEDGSLTALPGPSGIEDPTACAPVEDGGSMPMDSGTNTNTDAGTGPGDGGLVATDGGGDESVDDSCACAHTDSSRSLPWGLWALGLFALIRRRET